MLTRLILKYAVPGIYGKSLSREIRTRCGIVSGVVGIACNILLVIVKITLAILSGSIAVAADAINNLSDAGSGVITIAGFRISSRPPDAEHPFGHGRTEYVAGLVVSLLIVGLGITFLKDAVCSLITPRKLNYNLITIIFFFATTLVKCWLFFFYRHVAKLINSSVIRAAAIDSLSDCAGTLLVTSALVISRYTGIHLDGYAGIIVSLMILWGGVNVLKETVSKLLGEPPDATLVEDIKRIILSSPGIDGVHDIMIHNYGESSYYVTAHAEISSEGDRFSAHDILENAEIEVGKHLPVHLLLHGDPYNKTNPEVIGWRSKMENVVSMFDGEFKLYDFRLLRDSDGKVTALSFHMLIPHNYILSEAEITSALESRMSVYQSGLKLEIKFVQSYV